jgi:hypothetical protein
MPIIIRCVQDHIAYCLDLGMYFLASVTCRCIHQIAPCGTVDAFFNSSNNANVSAALASVII